MKLKLVITFLFILFLTGTLFALDKKRRIGVPSDPGHIPLTKSLYDQTSAMDKASRKLVYISYVAGFVDAMEMNYVDSETAKRFIKDCENLTLGDLIDGMLDFKEENFQWRGIVPAEMLTVVIPRLKKGLSPFPEGKPHLSE